MDFKSDMELVGLCVFKLNVKCKGRIFYFNFRILFE